MKQPQANDVNGRESFEPPWLQAPILAVTLGFVILFMVYLPQRYWSDSEIWGVRVGSLCFASWRDFACGLKPLYNGGLAVVDSFSYARDISWLMTLARGVTEPFWLASILLSLVAGVTPELLLCYIGSSAFLLDGSVARSDIWALPFMLCHLVLLVRSEKSRRWGLYLVLSGTAAVLITPKAAFSLLAFAPFYFAPVKNALLQRRKLTIAIGAAIVALALSALELQNLSGYLLGLFSQADYGAAYFDGSRFVFLERTVLENPQLSLAFGIWLFILCYQVGRTRSLALERRQVSALLLGFVVCLFPDRLPFWIATQVLIFLCLIGDDFLRLKHKVSWLGLLAGMAVLSVWIGWGHLKVLRESNNRSQAELIGLIDRGLMASPHTRVYDGIGLVNAQNTSNLFLGPGQSALNLSNIQRIREEKFDLILTPNRLQGLLEFFSREIAENYAEAAPGVFVRTREMVVQHPQSPAREIVAEIAANFGNFSVPIGTYSILVFSTQVQRWQWIGNFSMNDISQLGMLCAQCDSVKVRFTPFSGFFSKTVSADVSTEFAFEPHWVRKSFVDRLMELL